MDTTEYNKKYYMDNKEKLAAKRKERYATDEVYRDAQRERSDKRRKLLAEQKPDSTGKSGRPRKPVLVETINGTKNAFTIGHFATVIGRPQITIRSWIGRGVIPKSPFKTASGETLWTQDMIIVVATALSGRGQISSGDSRFTQEIADGWRQHGVTTE